MPEGVLPGMSIGSVSFRWQPMTAVLIAKRRTAMQMIGRMILFIMLLMLSPCRTGIAAQLKMSLISFL